MRQATPRPNVQMNRFAFRYRRIASLAAASAVAFVIPSACAVIPDAPNIVGTPWPEGSPVGLNRPVLAGDLAVTPLRVVEDSRCPTNARCTWTGRLVVSTRIDGDGWRDTANIALGETYGTHGKLVRLASALPAPETGQEIALAQYRFTYVAALPD